MKLTIEVGLTEDEETSLRRILRKQKEKWPAAFEPYAAAAVEEHARMFLGQRVFTRGSDMREYRLELLIRTAFGDKIPDEQSVCDLFQCTLSQSRTLLRAVMSKYQYELSTAISKTLSEVLDKAEKIEGKDAYVISVSNENVIAELNKVLARKPGQDEIARQTRKLGMYELRAAAYEFLREHLKPEPKA
jgi:hypothetical protein